MTWLESVILGVIEGLTEFLPVSSTGHLILANHWMGIDPEQPTTRAFLFVSQIGAIAAVVIYFWSGIWRRLRTFSPMTWKRHAFTKVLVAFLPAALIGLMVNDFMEEHLEGNPMIVAIALILGAGVIELIDRRCRVEKPMELEDVTYRQALIIGLAQCISMVPGTSRAGATIMGGMAAGLTPRVATEFSFYLAIPTICGAGTLRLMKYHEDLNAENAMVIGVGTLVAFVVALAVVAGFMSYVKRYRFTPFAVYRVVLGVVVLVAWL